MYYELVKSGYGKKKNSVFVYNNFITSKAYKKAFFAFRNFNMHLSKP